MAVTLLLGYLMNWRLMGDTVLERMEMTALAVRPMILPPSSERRLEPNASLSNGYLLFLDF
jgi:hypothetical protein